MSVPKMLFVLAPFALLLGCTSGGGTEGRQEDGGGRSSTTSRGLPPAPTPRTDPSRGDRRVILYQHTRSPIVFILVNEGHSGRRTYEGQMKIALNNPHQGYKVLSEEAMDALLKSMDERGFSQLASEFVHGDEQYLQPRGAGTERYRGMVYVEENGARRKILGYRPSGEGDADGVRKLQAFTDMKGLCLAWFNAKSTSEQPQPGLSSPRAR